MFRTRPLARAFAPRLPTRLPSRPLARGIATTPPAPVNPSLTAQDGGNEEAPHSGINVDTPVRMDT
jgi:hypothetical protein